MKYPTSEEVKTWLKEANLSPFTKGQITQCRMEVNRRAKTNFAQSNIKNDTWCLATAKGYQFMDVKFDDIATSKQLNSHDLK